jgi:hypothetical protein
LFSRDHWPTAAIWQLEEPVDEARPTLSRFGSARRKLNSDALILTPPLNVHVLQSR